MAVVALGMSVALAVPTISLLRMAGALGETHEIKLRCHGRP